jgi:endonuclease/exonuclease/phosphatase family metal-dependent hydrolase
MKSEFSLLSLNSFGVPFFLSWGRLARLATELESLATTVICLQEIQQNAYVPLLAQRLEAYPCQAIFPHIYAPKGGLGTFSRLPLASKYFEPYRDRGLRWLVTFSDWALYKGVLVTQLRIRELEMLILNTHLNANYSGDWRRNNPLARVQHSQVQQLSHLVSQMPADALVILCGDFNFPRASFLYEELTWHAGLIDPLHADPRPTYHPFPLVPSKWKTSLDYLFLRLPHGKDINLQADIVPVEDSTQTRPFGRFLSDHYALTLKIGLES